VKEFILVTPEIILLLTLVFVVIGEITYHGERTRLISATALIGLAGAFVETVVSYRFEATRIFGGVLAVDGLSLFFKLLFTVLAALAVITSMHTREIPASRRAEYCALIIGSAFAMSIAAASADMLLAFLSLQLTGVAGYFLAGYSKRSVKSSEAAVKYMAFCTASAALLMFGIAILFAHTRTLDIYEIYRVLMANPMPNGAALVVFMLMFLSFSFYFSAFPMHQWVPDVLEGAPTPAAAFISVASRAAGFAVALRFLLVIFAHPAGDQGRWDALSGLDWTRIVAFVSGLTMLVGALLAYRQNGAKRMVGGLVIAATGALLMGVLVLDQVGVAALLYNLVIELFALMGVFYVVSCLYDETRSDRFVDLTGMMARAVPECICLIFFLLCLVGAPPTPGFIGKFALIGAAIRHGWLILAIVAIVSMAISTVAVARLAFHLMGDFRRPTGPLLYPSVERKGFLLLLMTPTVLVGVFAEFVLSWAGKSLGFIFW
jgi:NADH-quinone oxidoreductase subunit N